MMAFGLGPFNDNHMLLSPWRGYRVFKQKCERKNEEGFYYHYQQSGMREKLFHILIWKVLQIAKKGKIVQCN